MVEIKGMNFPEGLFYSKDHMWVKVEDDVVKVGVTDLAQKAAGEIVFVRLLPPGRKVRKNAPLGTLESGKWVGPLKSPVTGTIVEVNEKVKENPKLLNTDPYGEGWLVKIKPDDFEKDKVDLISDPEALKEFIEAEAAKLLKE